MKVYYAAVVLGIVLLCSSVLGSKRYAGCDKGCVSYDLIVVGGGFSGVTATYLVDLVDRLNNETKQGLKTIDISRVLLLEGDAELGGDVKSKVSTAGTTTAKNLVNMRYNYTGPYRYDIGSQRTPQLTCRLQRGLGVDVESIQEFTPYITTEYTRGKVVMCGVPNFNDYSPSNPYNMASSCTDSFPFMGNNENTWKDNGYDETQLGPGYNYSTLQPWAYKAGPMTSINAYVLNNGPNPVTCNSKTTPCDECGDCFFDTSKGHVNLKAALLAQIGTEPTAAYIQDYGGFYADFEKGLFNATIWAKDFWSREYNTNSIYGYTVGSMQLNYIYKLAKPVLQRGTVMMDTFVDKISMVEDNNGQMGVAVSTTDGDTYYGDFLIYAGQPEPILSGKVKGDIAAILRRNAIFQSVYSVPVATVDVVLDTTYLEKLVPADINITGLFTKPWATLKGNGPDTLSSRVEYRHTIYSLSTNHTRPNVADFYTLDALKDLKSAMNNNNNEVLQNLKQQLWNALRVDQAYIHQIPLSSIPTKFVDLNINYIETGYYYVWSNTTTSAQQLMEFARAPLGENVPVCLAHEAWNPRYLGWGEAGMRASQRCIDRLIPKSSDLVECWLYELFPECPQNIECLNDPESDILGSETLIPSRYCSERWYTNDYKQTQNCVRGVKLTPTSCSKRTTPSSRSPSASPTPIVKTPTPIVKTPRPIVKTPRPNRP